MSALSQLDFQRLGPPVGSQLLVIGGCGGIGHALVQHSERLGLEVTIMDLPQAAVRRGIASDANFVGVDLRDDESIDAAFSKLQEIGMSFDGVAICSGYTKGHDRIGGLDTQRFDDAVPDRVS